MSDKDKKQDQLLENPASNNNGKEDAVKMFTQEELNAVISKRLKEEAERQAKIMEEKIAEARLEAERLAKMSAEEIERELTEKQKQELLKKEKEVAIKSNKILAYEKLAELGISTRLVDHVVDEDADVMLKKIELLAESWKEAVESAVCLLYTSPSPRDS